MDSKKLKERDQRTSKVKTRVANIISPGDIPILAKRLNVIPQTVRNWSKGYTIPVGTSMVGLCSSYGVPDEYIIRGVFKLKSLV